MVRVTNKLTGLVLTMDEAGEKALAHRADEFEFEELGNGEGTTDNGNDGIDSGTTDNGNDS